MQAGGYADFDEQAFLAQVKQKIGRNITPKEKSSTGWDKIQPTQQWWDSINPKGLTPAKAPASCKKIIQLFLGNL